MTDTPTPTTDAAEPAKAHGSAPVTIDLGDLADDWAGQSVTIRPHLSYQAKQRIDAAAAKATAEVAGNRAQRRARRDDPTIELTNTVTPLEFAVATVEECVLSWTLRGFDGQVLEANRAGVQSPQAPADLIDAIIDEIHYHYEQRAPKLRQRRS